MSYNLSCECFIIYARASTIEYYRKILWKSYIIKTASHVDVDRVQDDLVMKLSTKPPQISLPPVPIQAPSQQALDLARLSGSSPTPPTPTILAIPSLRNPTRCMAPSPSSGQFHLPPIPQSP
jgi:hypothetical protein